MWVLLTLAADAGATDVPGSIQGRVTLPASARGETWAYIDGDLPLAAAPPIAEMAQVGMTFVPSVLVIPRNTVVSFPNLGPEYHNVYWMAEGQVTKELGSYPKGQTSEWRFDVVGTYEIGCRRHSQMSAVIRVVDNPWIAPVERDGTFVLTGVPPGTWHLVVWSRHNNATVARDVDVRAGHATPLEINGGLE